MGLSRDIKLASLLTGRDGYLIMNDLGIVERGILAEYGLTQQGRSVDGAVDWRASGVTLYEMLIYVMVCHPLIVRVFVIVVAKGLV